MTKKQNKMAASMLVDKINNIQIQNYWPIFLLQKQLYEPQNEF